MSDSPFFCFDGIDGAGKTTQIEQFRDWLQAAGHDVLLCRDPGSTELGESIRSILLTHSDTPIGMRTEMLLYMSARAQLVEQIIRPALEAGRTVISDRFLLANVVYQGHASGLDADQIWQVGRIATNNLLPDLTFVLDLPPALAAERRDREPDRVEGRGDAFLHRVREGFLSESLKFPEIVIIDAAADAETVQAEIQQAATQFFESRNRS